ncbi:hypothetical protein MASR2M8_15210 [Opitutaceae bacterium]
MKAIAIGASVPATESEQGEAAQGNERDSEMSDDVSRMGECGFRQGKQQQGRGSERTSNKILMSSK